MPSLFHQINKSYESGNNIQSAVFSECAYAQTLANMLNFNLFVNCSKQKDFIPEHIVPLLDEQKGLNFFESTGHNINNFSEKSVVFAALKNFSSQKYADVICTEDIHGNLVIIPADQIYLWADIIGEIRTAGRNYRKVWTPDALKKVLFQKGATVYANTVKIDKRNLRGLRARGGNRISGYKINPLFFVHTGDCADNNGILTFDINNVRQLIPTVSVHVFFKELLHQNVKEHYNL